MNSRAKGNRGEREVAALLQAWWEKLEPGCRFVRTPSSGGWSTADVRAEFSASGDLMTTAKRFPFAVEVKYRQAWSEANLLAGKRSPCWSWWAQACKAADEVGLKPLLFFRKSNQPWKVMFPWSWAGKSVLSALSGAADVTTWGWDELPPHAICWERPPGMTSGEALLSLNPEMVAKEEAK